MADTLASEPSVQVTCEFKSRYPHQFDVKLEECESRPNTEAAMHVK